MRSKFFVALLLLSSPFGFAQQYSARPEFMPSNQEKSEELPSSPTVSFNIKDGGSPKWIWGPDSNRNYTLRKRFESLESQTVTIRASADNRVKISLNGEAIGSSDSWESGLEITGKQLRKGENVIEAKVENDGGPAAFTFKLIAKQTNGKLLSINSDDSWEVIGANGAKDKVQVVANYGDGPWGDVLANGGSKLGSSPFNLLPGFRVERLFRVPREELGSWVCLTVDPKGRLIASDQENRGLYRITPAKIGTDEETVVEKLKVDISSAQGLLFAFDSLYVCVNGNGSGLYRLRDTDNDDQFDEKTKLFEFRGGGEHGPHALRLSPDGKSIVVVGGNHTLMPTDRQFETPYQEMGGVRSTQLKANLPESSTSRIVPTWDEDVLPKRQWDANGHATGIYAPGGWIAQTDPEGKKWEILSIGYRNQYDFDFNADGEMFVYDSDMEWDMGTSWYRPTRVVHASSGSEFGWRSGTACWPTYFADSLPSLVDIGPGSPVGVTFGYGAKFPAKYQKALYLCDWTFGTMYAIHMQPEGSSYRAIKEEFVSRTPLPLTDAVVGADGALYFTVGGRGTQSELYRVTYTGKEPTQTVDYREAAGAQARAKRHKIEELHHANNTTDPAVIKSLVSELSSEDRYTRYAARVALERVPVASWQELALGTNNPTGVIEAAIGLARVGERDAQEAILVALGKLTPSKLSRDQKLALLRAYQLSIIRLGHPEEGRQKELADSFSKWFPDADDFVTRELATLLVGLNAPDAPSKIVPLLSAEKRKTEAVTPELLERNRGYGASIAAMLANQPDLQQVHLAFVLREQKSGWNLDLRKQYFEWFLRAQQWSGGNSYQKFLVNISNDAFSSASDADRLAMEALGLRTPPKLSAELPKPVGPGRDYGLDEILKIASERLKGRNFENGKKTYAAARCVVCHRFGGEGGSTGPDLTQVAGRFALKDLVEAMVDPSKVISDQYKTVVIETDDGSTYTGRIVADSSDSLVLLTDPEDSTKIVKIAKSEIAGQKNSDVSVMPKDLLKTLNEDELLDLVAYMLSRGNPNDALYQKP